MSDKEKEERKKRLSEVIYDGSKNSPHHICSMCECPPNYHIVQWPCPIFENELICGDCCQVGCLRESVAEEFSKKLGRKITVEEINERCGNCGRNYAMQDEQLADDIESGKVKVEEKGDAKEDNKSEKKDK